MKLFRVALLCWFFVWLDTSISLFGIILKSPHMIIWPCLIFETFFQTFFIKEICLVLGRYTFPNVYFSLFSSHTRTMYLPGSSRWTSKLLNCIVSLIAISYSSFFWDIVCLKNMRELMALESRRIMGNKVVFLETDYVTVETFGFFPHHLPFVWAI